MNDRLFITFVLDNYLSQHVNYFFRFLIELVLTGNATYIFICRRLSNEFKAYIDNLNNTQWNILHNHLINDPIIGKFIISRKINMHKAERVNINKETLKKSIYRKRDIFLLLNVCKQYAIKSQSFDSIFDIELRAFLYYELYKIRENKKLVQKILNWWLESIIDLKTRKSREFLEKYIIKMAKIAFHGCRLSNFCLEIGFKQADHPEKILLDC